MTTCEAVLTLCFYALFLEKIFGKKYRNQAKLGKTRKLWYLFLYKFWPLVEFLRPYVSSCLATRETARIQSLLYQRLSPILNNDFGSKHKNLWIELLSSVVERFLVFTSYLSQICEKVLKKNWYILKPFSNSFCLNCD